MGHNPASFTKGAYMWFKNLRIYKLTDKFDLSGEALHELLGQRAFRRCGSLETSSLGWVSPLGRSSQLLTHTTDGRIMVCLRKEEKVLPAAVVREIVDEKVEEIEAEQMRMVRRKERESIRDEVMQDLLPRAFTRSKLSYAYIDPRPGWILSDSSTATGAEELISLLRETLGSLPTRPMEVSQSPAAVMTAWLQEGLVGSSLELGDECELRDLGEEGGVVRCRRQDLGSDEIQAHLRAGKQAVKLALEWSERLSCVLGDDLSMRRLRFLDLVQEEAADAAGEDDAARFDTDFALMGLELARFIPQLLEVFGGERDGLERAA